MIPEFSSHFSHLVQKKKRIFIISFITFCAVILILAGLVYKFVLSAPSDFQTGTNIMIDPGQSLTSIAHELSDRQLIRSSFVFKVLAVMFGGQYKISAGLYVFDKPQNVVQLALRIVEGKFGYVPVKFTVPEGTNAFKLTALVHDKFPDIDQTQFLMDAKEKEGYLFPNTYFLPPQATPDMIITIMNSQFAKEIAPFTSLIASSTHSEQDIITMASILEGEVQTDTDRRMVADILWRRIQAGMRLQVDSTFAYVNGKTSAELTLKDLQIDSPYNTYRYKGLPPTPISNPGIQSIQDALTPIPNDYLYFLSDAQGITHYARTNAEQEKLKQQYLSK